MSFAREAWVHALPPALLAVAAVAFGWWLAGALLALLAFALLLFFRIPGVRSDADESVVLSAADGRVMRVEPAQDPEIDADELTRVVTFLSVFDVHVQRAPITGRTVSSRYTRGRKVAAFRPDAGDVNEQRLTVLESPSGVRVGVRQIAGLVARRVVCYLAPGRPARRGELMGLIRFGSRVDVLVPAGYTVLVSPGNRVRGGVTPLARPATLSSREGETT
ncbi:MAG: phosphatidylserine decarboxylase [Thermoanaerobaculia bacterium]